MRRASSSGMLKGYLAHRAACDETFLAFSRRHEVEELKSVVRCGERANDAKLASADRLRSFRRPRRFPTSSAPGSTAFLPVWCRSTALA